MNIEFLQKYMRINLEKRIIDRVDIDKA